MMRSATASSSACLLGAGPRRRPGRSPVHARPPDHRRPAGRGGRGRLRRPRGALAADRPGLLVIADKGYVSAELDRYLTERGVRLIRPSYRNRRPHPGEPLLKSIRQLIESVNDTLKGQLNLEQHDGRTIEGVGVRIAQRLLALTAAIWHNRTTGQPITRSLTAYDH